MKAAPNEERCTLFCSRSRRSVIKVIPVAIILALFWTINVCALNVRYHGIAPAPHWHQHQRLPMHRWKKSAYSSSRSRLASFTPSSMMPSDDTSASLSTTSSSASSNSVTPSASQSLAASSPAPGQDSDADTVPIDTPARKSLPSDLCLRSIHGKGLGVICLNLITKGKFLGEYKGEVMVGEVKDRRYISSLKDEQTQEDQQWIQSRLDRGQTLTGCYLYGVSLLSDYDKNNNSNKEERSFSGLFIDAEDEYKSSWTRFINHASEPHNNVNSKSVYESFNSTPTVQFIANRDIEKGEELCVDYGDTYWSEGDHIA